MEKFKNESYKKEISGIAGTHHFRFLRVMNGELCIDWPWGARCRFRRKVQHLLLFILTLNNCNDFN